MNSLPRNMMAPPQSIQPKFHVAGKCCCQDCGRSNVTLYGKGDVKFCRECGIKQVQLAKQQGVIK